MTTHLCSALWVFPIESAADRVVGGAMNAWLDHHRTCLACRPAMATERVHCLPIDWQDPTLTTLCVAGRALFRRWEAASSGWGL